MFSFEFSTLEIVAIATAAFAVLVLLALYLPSVTRVSKFARRQRRYDPDDAVTLPDVSVIVYANNDAHSLMSLIPSLMGQRYNGRFEVIVVNDGSSSETDDVVSRFEMAYQNLSQTFIPSRTRNLSRKKLAISIGMKASAYDYAVLIMADSKINSETWLASMTRHFLDEGKELVIGYVAPDETMLTGRGSRFRAFDSLVDDVEYLSQAILGNPFRGTEFNIAYSKRLFFDNNGFSTSTHLVNGDDDIFVARVAKPKLTAVELSEPSAVQLSISYPTEVYHDSKLRYMFTAGFIKNAAHLLTGFFSVMMWIWLVASIAALALAGINLAGLCVVTVLSLALWLPICFAWKRASATLFSRKAFLSAPFWLLYRPFNTIKYKLRLRSERESHYTWYSKG